MTAKVTPVQAVIVTPDLFELKATAPVLCAAFLTIGLFALTPITTRLAVGHLDGLTVGLARTVLAAPVAAALLLIWRLRPPADLRQWRLLLVSAGAGCAGFPILFSLGTQRTTAAHACLCMAAIPLFTALIGMVVERQRPRPGWVAGAGLAICGEVLLVSVRDPLLIGQYSVFGDGLVLASSLSVACGFVAGSRLTAQTDSWSATFWSVAIAGGLLAPWLAIRATATWTELGILDWTALAHLSIGASVIGWIAWFYALARGGVARVAVLQFLQPVLSLIFAATLLGEAITMLVSVIAATILVGVMLARRYAQPATQVHTASSLWTRDKWRRRSEGQLPGRLAGCAWGDTTERALIGEQPGVRDNAFKI